MSGVAPGIDSPPSFPEFLLEDVLDYLDLEDLLLVAMPVNRYWRQNVINHRQYWSYVDMTEDALDSLQKSVPLFLLRLSRTEARPIAVRVSHSNPGTAVFVEVAQHLSHITYLFVHTSPDYARQIFDVFRAHPAPSLTQFYLISKSCSPAPEPDPVVIPDDMFASAAPVLHDVYLSQVELPAGSPFPPFLANARSLAYSTTPGTPSQLPNIFLWCPRLQWLELQGSIALDDPAFMQASNWERLREASFNIFNFDVNKLPISGVHRVIYHAFEYGTDVVIDTAQRLTEPLSVAFSRLHPGAYAFGLFTITLRSTVTQVSHARGIIASLPTLPPGEFPAHTITAFRNAPLVDTIVRLVIGVSNWDELVGLGYLTGFPSLEDLVLTVNRGTVDSAAWPAPDPQSRLSCPRLYRLTLRRWNESRRPVVEVAAVASFVRACLSDTTFPLRLELNEVALDGSWKDFPAVFSRCDERELTDLDDNI